MERRLDKTRLCALLIDATPFQGQQLVVALGINEDGRKTILGIRQGATENATVVGELLGELVERGLDFSQPRLYVLDGGKALTAAVKKYAGESAAIQRCQVHKRRNVLDHLTDEQKPGVAKQLNAAYGSRITVPPTRHSTRCIANSWISIRAPHEAWARGWKRR